MADKNEKKDTASMMPMTKKGLVIMIAGLVVMVLGYILMMGGGSKDPNVFNEAMFSARRLVVAPIVIAVGVIIETVAIMGWFGTKKK